MRDLQFSFIVPVYNRPQEVERLLESMVNLKGQHDFEVVVIEDGSTLRCDNVCSRFRESVNISYIFKENGGPGQARNFGMRRAKGNYFIILDSDCLLPTSYLQAVQTHLSERYVDCYGGPDAAHEDFSDLQKAINYSMTSFLTTGGIRGGSEAIDNFQPRSFNMGLSKEAFEASQGFGDIHPGEDPDLSMRLRGLGYKTALITEAYVYHERRISWRLFYKQVKKFGMVRIILNKWHPGSSKLTYVIPTLFLLYSLIAILVLLSGSYYTFVPLIFYLAIVGIDATIKNNLKVGCMSIYATMVQFYGYGWGFLMSYIEIFILRRKEREAFPQLFFDSK
jgi:glycosyltransferase involved in cell wall biosynthesis